MSDAKLKSGGIRLTKEERKDLLAQLERQSSRAESPKRILQRGEQALRDGQIDQARRVLKQLDSLKPRPVGLELFQNKVEAAIRDVKHTANLRATEEMLSRYIQQRKKPLAELALTTLTEIAPDHPRLDEYSRWVADLDQELVIQRRIEELLAAGRTALRRGDLKLAEKHLGALNKVDPHSSATEQLAAEIAGAAEGQALSAGIERGKHRLEELLAGDQLDEAEKLMEQLSGMDIPKVTIDFLRQRVAESRRRMLDREDAEQLILLFENHLAQRDWPTAREAAQHFGRRFPSSSRTADLFRQINDLEAMQRRQQSLEEGLNTLERFIAEGDRHNAQLALKLLASLDLEAARLAQLETRVKKI